VTTVLQYLVIATVIGLVVFGIAIFVFGRGEQMAPLSPRTSPTELPDESMTAEDIRKVRFPMAVRGYRMSDVDWALERMADEVDRLRAQLSRQSADTPAVRVVPDPPATVDDSAGGADPQGTAEPDPVMEPGVRR
jgi:DivIVA domain-containing protein